MSGLGLGDGLEARGTASIDPDEFKLSPGEVRGERLKMDLLNPPVPGEGAIKLGAGIWMLLLGAELLAEVDG